MTDDSPNSIKEIAKNKVLYPFKTFEDFIKKKYKEIILDGNFDGYDKSGYITIEKKEIDNLVKLLEKFEEYYKLSQQQMKDLEDLNNRRGDLIKRLDYYFNISIPLQIACGLLSTRKFFLENKLNDQNNHEFFNNYIYEINCLILKQKIADDFDIDKVIEFKKKLYQLSSKVKNKVDISIFSTYLIKQRTNTPDKELLVETLDIIQKSVDLLTNIMNTEEYYFDVINLIQKLRNYSEKFVINDHDIIIDCKFELAHNVYCDLAISDAKLRLVLLKIAELLSRIVKFKGKSSSDYSLMQTFQLRSKLLFRINMIIQVIEATLKNKNSIILTADDNGVIDLLIDNNKIKLKENPENLEMIFSYYTMSKESITYNNFTFTEEIQELKEFVPTSMAILFCPDCDHRIEVTNKISITLDDVDDVSPDFPFIHHNKPMLIKIVPSENHLRTNKRIEDQKALEKALDLMESKRIVKQAEAIKILKNLTESMDTFYAIKIHAYLGLGQLLLYELKASNDYSLINDINKILINIEEISNEKSLDFLIVETNLIRAKMSLIEGDLNKSNEYILKSFDLIEKKSLEKYKGRVEEEQILLSNQIDSWKRMLRINATLVERINHSKIDAYIVKARKLLRDDLIS